MCVSNPIERRAGLRVLVIDAEGDRALTAALLLGLCGNEADVALDRRRALEMASRTDFDAVLLDGTLPDAGTDEMAAALKRLLPHSFLVAVSHRGQDRPPHSEVGVDMHLAAPVAAKALIGLFNRLRRVVGGKWRVQID